MKLALIAPRYTMWLPLSPESLYAPGRMVGGGETALIKVSEQLAARGHSVVVYAHTDQPSYYGNVRWVPLGANHTFRHEPPAVDVAVSYDAPYILKDIRAFVKVLENQTNHPIMIPGVEIDTFVFKSEWHRNAVQSAIEDIDTSHYAVIGNGVDLALYQEPVEKVPGRIIWTSSPDRGLHHALEVFRRLRERMPHATFHVYYDLSKAFEASKWKMELPSENLWRARQMLDTVPGVTYVGPVDKRTLARAQQEAEILLFPEDTPQPSEGFCISILESLAARCLPLISDCDALPELWGSVCPMLPLPIDYDVWADAAYDLLLDAVLRRAYVEKAQATVQNYTWERMGAQYDELLTRLYHSKPCPTCGQKMVSHDEGSR